MYTPAIQRVRRIAAQERRQRFLGTDFTKVRPVEILDTTRDYTAQVNTGDEKFCAS